MSKVKYMSENKNIRVADAFKNGKAFIPFITCGDPDLKTTAALVKEMEKNGADLIELGIPFSDPTAEGPVIQGANLRSLTGGTTTDKIFAMVKELRSEISIPLIFMTYANVVYSYGILSGSEPCEAFARNAAEAGINGVILADVSYEEKNEFAPVFRKYGIDFISMIAPTSEERISVIAKEAEGFIYVVSSMGVTGMRSEITTDIGVMTARIREANPDVPCAVGFGISTPAQAADMAQYADGVIVGSAIVNIIAEHGTSSAPYIAGYVRSMKDAIS